MKINFKKLLSDWDNILIRMCDEFTTHDVLEVVSEYLNLVISDCKDYDFACDKVKKAKKLLDEAVNLLDPEEVLT